MKYLLILFLSFFFIILSTKTTEARSGCCSHHGGVCGCGCCDGTSLSATCAPYYNCGGSVNYFYDSTPSCPAGSSWDAQSEACYCLEGYCLRPNKNGCVKPPQNAYCIQSKTDAWVCASGYKEVGNNCVKQFVPNPLPTYLKNDRIQAQPIASSYESQQVSSGNDPILIVSVFAITTGIVLSLYGYIKNRKD